MIRARVFILTTLAVAYPWAASVHAQDLHAQDLHAQDPPTGSPDVLIKLKPQDKGQPRKLVIGPTGVGLCPGGARCGDTVRFMWVGTMNEGEEIQITFDDTLLANACFGATGVTLTGIGPTNSKTLTVKESCTGKRALFYTAACQDAESGDCGGVLPVDPGMIIDGGK